MAEPPPGGAGTAAGPSVTGNLLGHGDVELDDLKEQAVQVAQSRSAKKPKLTHSLFFDDERGLRKVIRDFPKLRFRGKGHEFEDLKVLMSAYKKWFKDLYPFEDNMEDLIGKARTCLQVPEKENGLFSDPREQLHMLRFEYKTGGGGGIKEASQAAAGGRATPKEAPVLSEEVKRRIEENRQKALARKRQREAEADPEPVPAASFGFDDEEDVFGFGGGMDDAPAQQPAATAFDDDEDVFGFGGGMDDEDDIAPPPRPPATAPAAPPPAAKVLDPEAAKRVAENKARALEIKRKKQEEAAAKAAAAAKADAAAGQKSAEEEPPDMPDMMFEDEEDVFGFGGGMDD
eukprot:TRINITY_DN11329_c0_g1_i1.p1 TRINITY_DN11329_c0_g1~~TRINITY_DN11329_c0_g1_i1.p1  ORF type:complete len:345 (+),score=122.64 TRINITY_DN11329_c0_g1_i1:78-1112(+)